MGSKTYLDQLMQQAVNAKLDGDLVTYEYIKAQIATTGCCKKQGNNKEQAKLIKVKTGKR